MVKTVLSNFTLNGDQLDWQYIKPFDTMALCVNSSNWLRRLDYSEYTIVAFRKVNFPALLLGIEPRPCAKQVRAVASPNPDQRNTIEKDLDMNT